MTRKTLKETTAVEAMDPGIGVVTVRRSLQTERLSKTTWWAVAILAVDPAQAAPAQVAPAQAGAAAAAATQSSSLPNTKLITTYSMST